MKAADVCALEPKRVARFMADKELAPYDLTLQMLQEIPYGQWRELNPDESLRFYSVRMRKLEIVKSTPQESLPEVPTGDS